MAAENPSKEAWRAATAVAERRGRLFVDNTHREAYGFYPSQGGLVYRLRLFAVQSTDGSCFAVRRNATLAGCIKSSWQFPDSTVAALRRFRPRKGTSA